MYEGEAMYKKEWENALQRTERLGFEYPVTFVEMEGKGLLNDKRLRHMNKVLQPALEGFTSYEQLVGQCLQVHLAAKSVIEDWLSCPVFYTLGWVDDGSPKGIFRFDDDDIKNKLENGHHEPTINIHAWLTLPTYEVIDLTLTTTLCLLQGLKDGGGGVLAKKADDFKGFSYRPMLVGDEYLKRIGLIKDITLVSW